MDTITQIFGLLVFIACGIAFVYFFVMPIKVVRLGESFRQLAQIYGGETYNSEINHPLTVTYQFKHDGAHAKVNVSEIRGVYYTQIRFGWPDRDLRCEVYPERIHTRLGKMVGIRDIEIDSIRFDAQYVIRGPSESRIRDLLTVPVQETIDELRLASPHRDVYVQWLGGTLLVKVRGLVHEFLALRRFVELGLELFHRAVDTRVEGVEFVDAGSNFGLAACQICGDELHDDIVHCQSCKTPHHGECWEYYGACSTYGCGHTAYTIDQTQ